jgi:hypothetical protein
MKLPTDEDIALMRAATLKRAKHAKLAEKALLVLDSLLSGNDHVEGDPRLSKIYEIVHGCSPFTSCYDSHEAWREETKRMFDELIKEPRINDLPH